MKMNFPNQKKKTNNKGNNKRKEGKLNKSSIFNKLNLTLPKLIHKNPETFIISVLYYIPFFRVHYKECYQRSFFTQTNTIQV